MINWSIQPPSGAAITGTGASINADLAALGPGTYTITMTAGTQDGLTPPCQDVETVVVGYPPLVCNLNFTPAIAGTVYEGQSYTIAADVQNIASRAVTSYVWSITGPGGYTFADSGAALTSVAPPAFNTAGNYTVRYDFTLADGSTCYETRDVVITALTPPTCPISASPSMATLYSDGLNYTFSTTVTAPGRTVVSRAWTINGVSAGTGTTAAWTNNLTPGQTLTVNLTVTLRNPDGTTTDCLETFTRTVTAYPTLDPASCDINIPATNPLLPQMLGNSTQRYGFSTNANSLLLPGQTVTYNWNSLDGGNINNATSGTPQIGWPQTSAMDNQTIVQRTVGVTITVNSPASSGQAAQTCSPTATVNVQAPQLGCPAIVGGPIINDLTPVVGETVTYNRPTLTNQFGRTITSPITWTLEYETSPGVWSSNLSSTAAITTSNDGQLQVRFDTAGARYRLTYQVSVTGPTSTCVPPAPVVINVQGTGVNFSCDTGILEVGGSFNPNNVNAATQYNYQMDVDNGNGLTLRYLYELIAAGGTAITPITIADFTSTNNNIVSIPGAQQPTLAQIGPLGPGTYTLRLNVTNSTTGQTVPSCTDLTRTLVVGSVNTQFSVAYQGGGAIFVNGGTNNIQAGREVCFDNITPDSLAASRPQITNTLTYAWTLGGTATTGFTSPISGATDPLCLTFPESAAGQTGSVTLTTTGSAGTIGNSSTLTRTYNFTVRVLPTLTLNPVASGVVAPATVNFTAVGTNIFPNSYNWRFVSVSGGVETPVGTLNGRSNAVSFNFTSAGTYRAYVSGDSHLGRTAEVSQEFTLDVSSTLAASFVPSQTAGIAPMRVCFADQSTATGRPIESWSWDFDLDGTVDLQYTPANIPAEICYTYAGVNADYSPSLIVSNGRRTDSATNALRTYSLFESNYSFAIEPQGGGQYCFNPVVSGVDITRWDFGDGNTSNFNGRVCWTYSTCSSTPYTVTMNVENPSTGRDGAASNAAWCAAPARRAPRPP
ncbi:MAG: hypothetical protein HC828_13285, partial [Blastochloris sp.]|nr:hypothetical protein [Blastochloris sp.]